MKNLFKTVVLLAQLLGLNAQQVRAKVSANTEAYLKGVINLALIAILLPLPFVVLGVIIGQWDWFPELAGFATTAFFGKPTGGTVNWILSLPFGMNGSSMVAGAGLWCTFWLSLVAIYAAPLGIIVDMVVNGTPQGQEHGLVGLFKKLIRSARLSGDRYIAFARGILVWESFAFLCLSIIPLRNNLGLVPVFLLAVATLILMAFHFNKDGKVIRWIGWWTTIGVVVRCLSLFLFPKLTNEVIVGFLKSTDGIMTIAVIVILVVFGLIIWGISRKLFGAKTTGGGHDAHAPAPAAQAHSAPAGGGHGGGHGHGHGESKIWKWVKGILAFAFVLWVISMIFTTVNVHTLNRAQAGVTPVSTPTVTYVTLTPNRSERIDIRPNELLRFEPVERGKNMWVQYEGEVAPHLDWKGRVVTNAPVEAHWNSRFVTLTPEGNTPFVVEVRRGIHALNQ